MRHPLHPALVHFPVACWSLAVVADFVSLYFGQAAWQWATGLLMVGCVTAVVAMLAGMLEIARVPDGPAMRDAYLHMSAMLLALVLFITRLFVGADGFQPAAPSALALVLDAAGFISLAVGGWLGGRLVYGHGVGGA